MTVAPVGCVAKYSLAKCHEPVRRLLEQINHVHVRELLAVELGVGLVHARQVEELHDVGDGHLLAVVAGIPAEQCEIVHQRLGQEMPLLVFLDQSALVALRHLALPHLGRLQDERDVREDRRRDAETLVKPHVLARVGQVVLAADDVRDLHLDVVHDVHEMEHRVAVGAEDHEVLVLLPLDPAANPVVDDDRRGLHLLDLLLAVIIEDLVALAEQLEPDGAVLLVGAAAVEELLLVALVDVAALALAVGTVVAAAVLAENRALVPVHPEPVQALVDQVEEGLAVARLIRVLDAQDERAAGVAGIKPVEQRRAGAADVEEARGTGREADTNLDMGL
jgi:hypothetical protein